RALGDDHGATRLRATLGAAWPRFLRGPMKIHDISIPMSPSVASWPGDAPYEFQWTMQRKSGASVNVGQIRLSVHAGTHTDAPFHFADDGKTIDRLALEPYVGP